MSQQQQQDEERRRQEEELQREQDKINAYANAHVKRDKDIMTRYDDRHEWIYAGRTDSGGSL